jgi:hypothetical protein
MKRSLFRSADDKARYDLIDASGRILLLGATHHEVCLAGQACMRLPGWVGTVRYCLVDECTPRKGLVWPWRHEGPLVLVRQHYGDGYARVYVQSHAGACALALEEAMRRLDQFSAQHQAVLLAALADHFGIDPRASAPTA